MNKTHVDISAQCWRIHNGCISMELERLPDGSVALASLTTGGREWAARGGEMGVALVTEPEGAPIGLAAAGYRLTESASVELPGDGIELVLSFLGEGDRAQVDLIIRCFPACAVFELLARVTNRSDTPLPLAYDLWPLSLPLKAHASPLHAYTQEDQNHHGFIPAGEITETKVFEKSWLVLEDATDCESLFIGGDMGTGMLNFAITVETETAGIRIRAGANLPPERTGEELTALELSAGATLEAPLTFLALAQGGPDEVANEAFRYLRRHVMPEPLEGSPFATYSVWLTMPDSEGLLRDELAFAKRVGFDVFCHDASWMAGSTLIPGMNDFTCGLGSFEEDVVKFPHGLQDLSQRVHEAGMKFGLWVDPSNIDCRRVTAGEFTPSWLAMKNGKLLEHGHPSLSPSNQLCMGNPEVVAWLKEQLAVLIERYSVDYIKWDASGTASYACDCHDHGHGARSGTWAAYAGRMEILSHLMARFPQLCGFECDPSLHYSRTNPGPRSLLPGGYTCEFMTGPMVSPYVWGSLASVKTIDSVEISELTSGWCSASTLDYSLRQHLIHGVAYGNINAMWSQMLSKAPAGYIEAYMRNLYHFKKYRHLLFGNVWHPTLATPDGWTALEYTSEDACEAVLFAFRHKGGAPDNTVKLKALDPEKNYLITNLNDRPGRERHVTGASLATEGIHFSLPDQWIARGDWFPGDEYDSQLEFGSDIILITEEHAGR